MSGRVTQKEKVRQFVAVTGASEKEATKALKLYEWSVERAIDGFFNQPVKAAAKIDRRPSVDSSKLAKLFTKYKDGQEDSILVEGTEALCNDLNVDPTDVVMLVIAYHLNAPRMCEFSLDGWIKGWSALNCDTIEKMKAIVPTLREELSDEDQFKNIYEFTFVFSRQEGQKSLPVDMAIALWQLLLKGRFELLDQWCTFTKEKYGKAISRDTWNLLLEFVRNVHSDLSNYDEDGAWPVLIDDFVHYMKQQQE